MPSAPRVCFLLLLVAATASTGCVRRVIDITSEPSGATVWLNDREIGRTPCSAEFTYYGTYDVRMELEGREPLQGRAEAKAPLFDVVGIDLISEILPARMVSRTEWHFTLEPTASDQATLVSRARAARAKTESLAEPLEGPPTPETP